MVLDHRKRKKMLRKDTEQIMREFALRQTRQIVAIAITMFLVLLSAVLYKRPGLFGDFSKATLFGLQAVCIASFIGFTNYNWRCPSCEKYLGPDIHRRVCRKCGARLK